jgi:hypothetical protein
MKCLTGVYFGSGLCRSRFMLSRRSTSA